MTAKTLYRRMLPPEFLREAAARKVNVGKHPPAGAADPGVEYLGVWVWQTGGQYADALELSTLLRNEYARKGENCGWVDSTKEALINPPREVIEGDTGTPDGW